MTRITRALLENQKAFLIISRSILLRIRIVADKSCRENETHILCSETFSSENRAVYKITWKNTVLPARPQVTIWRTRIACRITKGTNTHSEYVTLLAFPLQQ